MKTIPVEHIKRMEMMTSYFENNAASCALYTSEYLASEKINTMIKTSKVLDKNTVKEIAEIIANVEKYEHKNDIHWYDYKIHVNAILKVNGFNANLF